MKNVMKYGVLLIVILATPIVNADEQAVRDSIARLMPTVKPDLVSPSEVKGMYEVMVGTNLFYMSEDGKYMIQGDMIDLDSRRNVSEGKVAKARVNAINKVAKDQMILFAPKESKHKVTVFTDIDCGYCRKLHAEIDQYLGESITVQYLFFPRAGKGSESYKKAVSVWCSDDRNKALTSAKKGETPEEKECDNPVDEHMALGGELGVRGTPMLVTENGTVFPGYMPAERLVKALEADKADKTNKAVK